MTATHETLARPSSLSNAATAIFALLGLIDVALAGVIGSPGAPPLIVSLGVAAPANMAGLAQDPDFFFTLGLTRRKGAAARKSKIASLPSGGYCGLRMCV